MAPINQERSTFYVGINALVMRDEKLLLGLRRNVYGDGTWGLPGGHLEPDESIVQGINRELMEETGLVPTRLVFFTVIDNMQSTRHYLQFAFLAEGTVGEPTLREPDCCEEWQWFSVDALPQNLFPPHEQLIASALKGDHYAES